VDADWEKTMKFRINETLVGFDWVLLNRSRPVAMSCRSFTRRETCVRAIKKLMAELHLNGADMPD